MTPILSHDELYRQAERLAQLRVQLPSQAWPQFGKDFLLAEEDGPAGSLLFSCHTDESMSNPLGIVHGGVTASLLDSCMGATCIAQCGTISTPTITMTVNYARPVPLNADILVRTHIIRVGATSGQLQAEVFLPDRPEEFLATATGVYSVKR